MKEKRESGVVRKEGDEKGRGKEREAGNGHQRAVGASKGWQGLRFLHEITTEKERGKERKKGRGRQRRDC